VPIFDLFITNGQITTNVKDLSTQDDTDVAYGYTIVSLDSVASDKNIQFVLKYLSNRYKEPISNADLSKIEQLRLFDGRVNYKIVYKNTRTQSEFKFVIFYQPLLQKVLILNTVGLYQQSQYNQLSSEQQKSDKTLSSILSYINSIHPEVNGFTIVSVNKADNLNSTEYNIILEKNNKRYRSLIRVSANNVDITEIKFAEMMEVSLDHYRLDQYD
jgi:hypothetical protein